MNGFHLANEIEEVLLPGHGNLYRLTMYIPWEDYWICEEYPHIAEKMHKLAFAWLSVSDIMVYDEDAVHRSAGLREELAFAQDTGIKAIPVREFFSTARPGKILAELPLREIQSGPIRRVWCGMVPDIHRNIAEQLRSVKEYKRAVAELLEHDCAVYLGDGWLYSGLLLKSVRENAIDLCDEVFTVCDGQLVVGGSSDAK